MNSPEPIMEKNEAQTPMQLLEQLLKKNLPEEERDDVDLSDEVYQWFYFDQLRDKEDLERAWSVFPEQAEIRRRLAEVERAANTVPSFGYRVAKENQAVAPADLAECIRLHLEKIRPLLPDRAENKAILRALDAGPRIELAPEGVRAPKAGENDLFLALYEAMQEPKYEIDRGEHYGLLSEWAIYLTKCDEVALYLLWPALPISHRLPPDTALPAVRLWAMGCRDCFWFKDQDPATGTVWFTMPSPEQEDA
jgi:hypothetical protein